LDLEKNRGATFLHEYVKLEGRSWRNTLSSTSSVYCAHDLSVVIEVNVERPELNGGKVLIYPTSSIPGVDGKAHYHGFLLLLQMDPR
jgi:hypothetical protein